MLCYVTVCLRHDPLLALQVGLSLSPRFGSRRAVSTSTIYPLLALQQVAAAEGSMPRMGYSFEVLS